MSEPDTINVKRCSVGPCPFYLAGGGLPYFTCVHPKAPKGNDIEDEPGGLSQLPAWCPLRSSATLVRLV